ncbi:hypothetical protein CONLIGDRAFT_684577 [Coniochaeta ligniaria NRRL 30616]|uniref:Uncharacterized protein n=1 Tax=Coniochaeta ligniaria NRRL 30616 TaxID=1408157 RepID=A0A1J7J8C3_9PEZI|nr:hypothetical protein CONLIGDRAFT_684577 [Coniochaeta ligniaria NRRL 30616]
MATLQQVCWPYSVGRVVGASLFTAAAVELVVPWLREDVANARQPIGIPPKEMTVPPSDPIFADHEGGSATPGDHAFSAGNRPRTSPRTTSIHALLGTRRSGAWGWDWRVSLLLLASHFLILRVTSRYGALCAVRDDETWPRW